jgi:hypothetical protein
MKQLLYLRSGSLRACLPNRHWRNEATRSFPQFRIDRKRGGGFPGTGVNEDRRPFQYVLRGRRPSITKGKHLIRIGFEGSQYQLNRFTTSPSGSVTYKNTKANAFQPGDPALLAFQNFLLAYYDY